MCVYIYIYTHTYVYTVLRRFSRVRHFCDTRDCSPAGYRYNPLSTGILQARMLEWVASSSSRGSSQLRDQTRISCTSCIAGGFFTTEPPGKHMCVYYTHIYTILAHSVYTHTHTHTRERLESKYSKMLTIVESGWGLYIRAFFVL